MKNNFLLISLIVAVFVSCTGREQYPIEPQLTFNDFKLLNNDSISVDCVLIIDFTDGDGDIGFDDTAPKDEVNLFIDYYELQNGNLTKIDTINFNARIPYLTPSGENKNIKGTIYDTLQILKAFIEYDTIAFSIYLEDRALNKSNVIETPLIKIK